MPHTPLNLDSTYEENIQHLSFRVCLTLFNMWLPALHFPADAMLSFFTAEQNPTVCIYRKPPLLRSLKGACLVASEVLLVPHLTVCVHFHGNASECQGRAKDSPLAYPSFLGCFLLSCPILSSSIPWLTVVFFPYRPGHSAFFFGNDFPASLPK